MFLKMAPPTDIITLGKAAESGLCIRTECPNCANHKVLEIRYLCQGKSSEYRSSVTIGDIIARLVCGACGCTTPSADIVFEVQDETLHKTKTNHSATVEARCGESAPDISGSWDDEDWDSEAWEEYFSSAEPSDDQIEAYLNSEALVYEEIEKDLIAAELEERDDTG